MAKAGGQWGLHGVLDLGRRFEWDSDTWGGTEPFCISRVTAEKFKIYKIKDKNIKKSPVVG